jgi:divalent metal cation (Fe/Co/Zn/Cd) transporter
VHAKWYAFVVVAAVLAIDVSRTVVSSRAARRYRSAALASNAVHFGSDFLGTSAVLVGLIGVRAGWQRSDSVAALFVAALVLAAAVRLMRRNVDVLMDRAPAEAAEAARTAIARIDPPVSLRRLRMRQAAGRHFADVVIGVAPDSAVGQAHAVADAVEEAVERAVPEADVVVHVEPLADEAEIRELAHAAALNVPRVREVHNVSVLDVNGQKQISLHLKLPGDLSLEDAHAAASDVEHAIADAVPGVESVQTHLEPLTEAAAGRNATNVAAAEAAVLRAVAEETGEPPRELRFMQTDEGLVAYLTLCLDPSSPLAEAHARASQIEERIRRERPEIADIIVHTEP